MTLRHRTRGGFIPATAFYTVYNTNGSSYISNTATQPVGVFEEMTDLVSRGFVPGKTWLNNPLGRKQTTRSHTPAKGGQTLVYPGWSGVYKAEGTRFSERDSAFDKLLTELDNFDTNSLVSLASTKALANVKKPEVAGLVAIAELKETVQSLLHPLDGVLNFLKRNAPSKRKRKRLSQKNVVGSAQALADQHLTIIFGIMPFISDIQGILKALKGFDPAPQVFTARGEASSVDERSALVSTRIDDDGNNYCNFSAADSVTRTVTVRAYQQYEATVSIADALGLSPSEVPRAIWQHATLSFVVDWFVNVSDFIAALTPQPGISYGIAGFTETVVDACTSDYNFELRYRQDKGWKGAYNSGSQQRVVLAKRRVPGSLFQNIGLHFKSNMHRDILDTYQITASISLITQRLKGRLL